ncbi:hypothetical protein [Tsukamurella soli]|uniref:Uncharacterized protein n=1 Tax=Tsukamurella soli TaxID=644556 RepID=A0ABP8KG68_9ACTN
MGELDFTWTRYCDTNTRLMTACAYVAAAAGVLVIVAFYDSPAFITGGVGMILLSAIGLTSPVARLRVYRDHVEAPAASPLRNRGALLSAGLLFMGIGLSTTTQAIGRHAYIRVIGVLLILFGVSLAAIYLLWGRRPFVIGTDHVILPRGTRIELRPDAYELRNPDGQLPMVRFPRPSEKPVVFEPTTYGLDLNNLLSALDLVTTHRSPITGREIAAVLAFEPPSGVAVGDSIDATAEVP